MTFPPKKFFRQPLGKTSPKMFCFGHFPKENILLLGKVIPNEIPYAKIKKLLRWGYTSQNTKKKSRLHFSKWKFFWNYVAIYALPLQFNRTRSKWVLWSQHLSPVHRTYIKPQKLLGKVWKNTGLTDWRFCILCSHNLFLLGWCCTIFSWSWGREDKLNLDSIKIKMVTGHRILCAKVLSLYILQYEIIQKGLLCRG